METHKAFSEKLAKMLANFGHKGTGSAIETGVSSNKNAVPNLQPRTLFDYDGDKIDKDWDGPRKAGYLAAYVDTFGPRFSLEKLKFEDGEIYPDKANIKTHLKYGCLNIMTDNTVVLTEKGRALIAPFVRVTDKEMETANASG